MFLSRESQGQGSLLGCRLWGHTESDMTEATYQQQHSYYWKLNCVKFQVNKLKYLNKGNIYLKLFTFWFIFHNLFLAMLLKLFTSIMSVWWKYCRMGSCWTLLYNSAFSNITLFTWNGHGGSTQNIEIGKHYRSVPPLSKHLLTQNWSLNLSFGPLT